MSIFNPPKSGKSETRKINRDVNATAPALSPESTAKKMKIEMLKYCMVWRFNDKQTVTYFKSRGVELSIPYFYELRREFLSSDSTRGWYHEQAIYAMESTHKQSIEQIDELIGVTLSEIQQHGSTPVHIEKEDKDTGAAITVLNPAHNSQALAKMMDSYTGLVKQRDDMLAATPVVQAIMNRIALQAEKQQQQQTTPAEMIQK